MFQTLRSRQFLSYAFLIVLMMIVVAAFLMLVLAVSQRSRLVPQVQQLADDYRAISRILRDLPAGQRDIRRAEVQETLAEELARIDGRLLLLDHEGEVWFDSGSQLTGQTIEFVSLPDRLMSELEPVLAGGPGGPGGGPPGRVVRFRDGGQMWIGTVRTMPNRGGGGELLLLNALPEATPWSAFRLSFLWPLLWAGSGAFLIAAVMAWWISRSVAQPLQTMSTAAGEIAAGRYDHELDFNGPREVTALARSFGQMAERVQQTQQAQKDFVANVSHDLKTPLTSIQGWSQAIVDGAARDPQQLERAATVIHTEAERMGRMVNQLLTLAKLEAGRVALRLEPVDLRDIAGQVRQVLAVQAEEKGVALTADTSSAEPLLVQGDHDALLQLFTNLVQNGLNNTPAGGAVALLAEQDGDGHPCLTVADTGRGIPAAELPRIFERFYQVDKARSGAARGTGLGLAIVKQIADAHQATITATSQAGEGSVFTVTFASPLRITHS